MEAKYHDGEYISLLVNEESERYFRRMYKDKYLSYGDRSFEDFIKLRFRICWHIVVGRQVQYDCYLCDMDSVFTIPEEYARV